MKINWTPSQVIKGEGRGNKLGFPTINIAIPNGFNHQCGVYAGWVKLNQAVYMGAFHFGPIPTFKSSKTSLEVYIIDQKNITPPASVSFLLIEFIRPTQRFSTSASLIHQIKQDVSIIKHTLKKLENPSQF